MNLQLKRLQVQFQHYNKQIYQNYSIDQFKAAEELEGTMQNHRQNLEMAETERIIMDLMIFMTLKK